MKKRLIFILITVGVLIIFGILYIAYLYMCEDDWCFFYEWQKERRANSFENLLISNEQIGEAIAPALKSKPILSNLGVAIEPLNKQTNKAGDLFFTKQLLFDDGRISNDKVFVDFGSEDKYLGDSTGTIEYWFYVPLKTQVISPIAGRVRISYIEHTKDWSVNINYPGSEYIVSFEHLVNVNLKEGNNVDVGDALGEASPRNTFNNNIAMVELAVWKGGKNIIKFCPFDFLEESIKLVYSEKINLLANEWEDFINKDVYKQEDWISPGCLKDMIVEA